MIINKSEDTVFFDVDRTLVLPPDDPAAANNMKVEVWDPITNKFIKMAVHEPMVRLLREADRRGSHIKVWSRGGWEWASNVVKALNLVECVDEVLTKPLVYFDDLDIKEWLPYRVYLEPNCNYKKDIIMTPTNKQRRVSNGV